MYQHLRISDFKGLVECTLPHPAKINVICGKNNSGKTTILEGICDSNSVAHGRALTPQDAAQLEQDTKHAPGWIIRTDTSCQTKYSALLKALVQSNSVWYSDESQKFDTEFSAQYAKDPDLKRFSFNRAALRKAYDSLFPQLRAILLPPKRHLQLEVEVDTAKPVTPTGEGVVNHLFFAKNQPNSASDRELYEQVQKAFNTISSGYRFDIFLDHQTPNQLRLGFSYGQETWRPASACGLGLQDLLVILYWSLHTDRDLILIEEPESHIHPQMQHKLLAFLSKDTAPEKQFLLSTHSNVFLSRPFVDRVFMTSFDQSVQVQDATSRASILSHIGYSVTDNLVSDLVILVEGPKDRPVIEEFLLKCGLLSSYDIKIWPLGGDIMDQLDLSVLLQAYSMIALIDNDPGSRSVRKRFTDNCKELGIPVTQLERYALENYFTLKALREHFRHQIPDSLKELDPSRKLEAQLGFNVKNSNGQIARLMTLQDIEGTDLARFFEEVRRICEPSDA